MTALLPLLILMTSLVPAIAIFLTPDDRPRLRAGLNLAGAFAKLGLVALMLIGVAGGAVYDFAFPLLPGLDFRLRIDALGLLFLTLSAFLWLLTTVYAIAYFEGTPNQSRFFGFFSLCVAATTGVALAGSLITFFIFYELLTLSTWPLVAHKGDDKSLKGARTYLGYTLGGSVVLLVGIVWLESLVGPVVFAESAALEGADARSLVLIFALLVLGLGVKAAVVPVHGWLPAAMVAPAPVSALLHAVAVVKAGAFGIVRIVYDVYGHERVHALGVGVPLAILAAATIVWGSLRALSQMDIKRRLAFSTVSQVSYILLGAAIAGPAATVGGLVHLVHQGLMKITLFFGAGALAERQGITRVDQLDGVGRRMPLTMFAFTLAAIGMIGVPPIAGFVSKWMLGTGAVQAGDLWVLFVLAASSLLNAAYFLPLIERAWFRPLPPDAPAGLPEGPAALIWPAVVTALVALMAGLFAGLAFSPLGWASMIANRVYGL